ncbi:MAG: hypothetical protein JWQ14_3114, partial [Adhaeribacter sp.]|nr:hypothetical protein [Adhaeribacter sp.]
MVDTTNNTTDNGAEDTSENPQRILERRLAELNSRKNEESHPPATEINSTENIIGGAVAIHEIIPPPPAVPVVGETPPVGSAASEPDATENDNSFASVSAPPNAEPEPGLNTVDAAATTPKVT